MRQFIIGICWAILFGWATAAAQTDAWQEYVYADDGFAISAPVEPTLEQRPIYVVGGTADAHIYSIASGEHSVFMVFMFQRHRDDRRSEQQVTDEAQEGAVGAVRGKLHARSEVALGRYRGAEIQFESQHPEINKKNHHIRNRYYVVGRKVFHLMAVAPLGEPFPADTDRWFKSFHLVTKSDRRR